MTDCIRVFNVSVNTNIIDKADGPTISQLERYRESKILTVEEIVANARAGYLQIFCHLVEDGRRVASNVLDSINILGFDVDGEMPYSNLDRFFMTHAAAIYTTASHRKPKGAKGVVADRYRILIPLPEPVDRLTAKFLIQRIVNTYKYLDPACKDPHRLWFGNTNAETLHLNPDAPALDDEWLVTARMQAQTTRDEAEEKRRVKDRELEFRGAAELFARRNIAREILTVIPSRQPGANNYDVSRNIVWALCDYVGENVAYDLVAEWSPAELNTQSWPVERILAAFDPAFEGVNGSITYRYLYSVGKDNGFIDTGYEIRLEQLFERGEDDPGEYAELALMGSQDPAQSAFKTVVAARVKRAGICTKGDFKEFLIEAKSRLEAEGLLPKFIKLKEATATTDYVRDNYGEDLAYNTQKCRTEYKGDHVDIKLFYIKVLCADNVEATAKHVTDAVQVIAQENSYHPVEQYLLDLAEDNGEEYPLMDVAVDLLKLKCGRSDRIIFKKWLLQCVARALDPGCEGPMCPILLGPQGFGKSQGIRALAGGAFFRESLFSARNSADIPKYLAGAWIHEIPEFEQIAYKKKAGEIKEMISARSDASRDAYAAEETERPRRCCLIGTSNEDKVLNDVSGNRRFPVFECDDSGPRVDLAEVARCRDAVWRSAVKEYLQWRDSPADTEMPWLLTGEEITEVNAASKKHVFEPDWIISVREYLEDYQESGDNQPLTNEQILFNANEAQYKGQGRYTALGSFIKREFPEWERLKTRIDGTRKWRYYSPAALEHYKLTHKKD